MMRGLNKRKGFSLAELLIVVAIIAVLVAIGVPIMSSAIEEAEEVTCKANCTSAGRECTYALLEAPYDTDASGRQAIVDKIMAGYNGDTLCPKHGKYVARILRRSSGSTSVKTSGGSSNFQEEPSAWLVIVTCDQHNVGEWEKGKRFEKGDIMVTPITIKGSGGETKEYMAVFECLSSHKSGSRSNTRNPTVKSNKGSWQCLGTPDGSVLPYSPTIRFGVGVQTLYNGNIYQRTTYNLTGGQTPYSKSSSRYWLLIGPAPATEP